MPIWIFHVFTLVLALALGPVQATVVLPIDDFSTDQVQRVIDGNTVLACDTFSGTTPGCSVTASPAAQASGAGILGGHRDIYTSVTSPSGIVSIVAGAGNFGGNSWLAVSNNALTTSEVVLVWDGAHAVSADPRIDANIDTTGLGGVDFTPTPLSHGILLEVLSIDLDVTATLDLWDMDGNKASVSHTFAAASDYTFQFADFLADNALLDLDRIGAVRLTLTGPEAWDGVFDLVGVVNDPPTPVPAPTTLALLGFGLLLSRRQQQYM